MSEPVMVYTTAETFRRHAEERARMRGAIRMYRLALFVLLTIVLVQYIALGQFAEQLERAKQANR